MRPSPHHRLAELAVEFSEHIGDRTLLLERIAQGISSMQQGAGVLICLTRGEGFVHVEAAHHPDPEALALVRDTLAAQPIRVGEGISGGVVASGKPLLMARVDPEQIVRRTGDAHRDLARRLGPRSLAVVPVRAGGVNLGAIIAWHSDPAHAFDEEVLSDLMVLGRCSGLALRNADLLASFEQALRDRDEADARRRELEARVQHAQKLESLGVLAGGIAHDLNNLLVGILGNISLAQLQLPASSLALDSLRRAETTAIGARS